MNLLVHAGMGVNLWGVSPLYVNPGDQMVDYQKYYPKARAVAVGDRLKEVGVQNYEPTNKKTAYKARSPGKSAQDYQTPDSGDRVNAAANVVNVHVLIRGELFGMRFERQRFQVFVNP